MQKAANRARSRAAIPKTAWRIGRWMANQSISVRAAGDPGKFGKLRSKAALQLRSRATAGLRRNPVGTANLFIMRRAVSYQASGGFPSAAEKKRRFWTLLPPARGLTLSLPKKAFITAICQTARISAFISTTSKLARVLKSFLWIVSAAKARPGCLYHPTDGML